MSLKLNNDIRQGSVLLNETNKLNFLFSLGSKGVGGKFAATLIAFTGIGAIAAIFHEIILYRSSTKNYDDLCAKFAKLSIQIQDLKGGGAGLSTLERKQKEELTELRGRVQKLTVGLRETEEGGEKADKIVQAAKYKLQRAYCAAKGVSIEDALDDDLDVIEEAVAFSNQLEQGLDKKVFRRAAVDLTSGSLKGIEKRVAKKVETLAKQGYCGGDADRINEELKAQIGQQINQRYVGTKGESNLEKAFGPMRSSQLTPAVTARITKCIDELRELAKLREGAVKAVRKNDVAIEEGMTNFHSIAEDIEECSRELEEERAELEREESAAKPNAQAIREITTTIAEKESKLLSLQKDQNTQMSSLKKLQRENAKLLEKQVKAESNYLNHLAKFFDLSDAPRQLQNALLSAGAFKEKDSSDDDVYFKFPTQNLKNFVKKDILRQEILDEQKKDYSLVDEARRGVINRAQKREEERARARAKRSVSLEERVAGAVVTAYARLYDEAQNNRGGVASQDRGSHFGASTESFGVYDNGFDGEDSVGYQQVGDNALKLDSQRRQIRRTQEVLSAAATRNATVGSYGASFAQVGRPALQSVSSPRGSFRLTEAQRKEEKQRGQRHLLHPTQI